MNQKPSVVQFLKSVPQALTSDTWVDGVKTEWAPDDNFAKTSLITEYVKDMPDYFAPEQYQTETA